MNIDDFFFLRPFWLLLLIPIAGLLWYLLKGNQSQVATPWQRLVDPHLLKHLVMQPVQAGDASKHHGALPRYGNIAALGLALVAASVALAGPAWQRIELPTFKAKTPVVIVLSLAQSMNATDLSPDRLTRAEHKVRDILQRNKGGDLAMVIYSDQPFAAAPLTSDAKVISDMLPELSTSLMPVLGNRLDLALEKATSLLTQAGARQGQILVLADDAGERPELGVAAARQAVNAGFQVSVLGVGTEAGAALQSFTGKSVTDQNGQEYTTRLAAADLKNIAHAGGGQFSVLMADNTDLDTLLFTSSSASGSMNTVAQEVHADAWNDMGYWLLFIPLLLAPLAFRKNLLLAALPLMMIVNINFGTPSAQAAEPASQNAVPQTADSDASVSKSVPSTVADHITVTTSDPTMASDEMSTNTAGQSGSWSQRWNRLWRTPDQQAEQAFHANDFQTAAQHFDNTDWKASALYRNGQFDKAASLYADNAVTSDDYYNHGNALANSGQLEPALAAYDEALILNPNDEDAQFNRDLIAKLLEQQKKEQEQEQEQDQQQAGGEQSQDQQQAGGEQSQDQQQAGGEQSQDQQQAGGEQSQDQQQAGGEQSQDQQQAGGEQSQDQQQAGGEQSQDQQQAGGEQSQDQQQAGGEQSQDQQRAGGDQSQDQQQAGGEQSQDQQQAGGEQSQDQQQAGGEQSQDQQQAGGEQSQDQQQAGGEQSQDQQQAGGEQSQDQQQAGGEQSQDQQQAGGEQSQDQQQADGDQSQDQQQAGGEQSQDQQQAGGEQSQDRQKQSDKKTADARNTFQKAMDDVLKGNGGNKNDSENGQLSESEKPVAEQGYSEQDQAIEQQLRKVPDDPSGLLRARIRQHYAQQRANRG